MQNETKSRRNSTILQMVLILIEHIRTERDQTASSPYSQLVNKNEENFKTTWTGQTVKHH